VCHSAEAGLKHRAARPSSAPALPAHRAKQAKFWLTRKAMRQDRQEQLRAMRPQASGGSSGGGGGRPPPRPSSAAAASSSSRSLSLSSSAASSSARHWTRALGEAQAEERSQRRAAEARKKLTQPKAAPLSPPSKVFKVSFDKIDKATRQMLMQEVTLQKLEYLYRQIKAGVDCGDVSVAGSPVLTAGSCALAKMMFADINDDAVAAKTSAGGPIHRRRDVAAEARAARARMMRSACSDATSSEQQLLSSASSGDASRGEAGGVAEAAPQAADIDSGACGGAVPPLFGAAATRASSSCGRLQRPSTATGHGRVSRQQAIATASGATENRRPRPATAEAAGRRQQQPSVAGFFVRASSSSRPASACRSSGPPSRPATATTAAASRPLSGFTARSSSGFSVRSGITPSSYSSPAMLLAPSSSAPRLMTTPGPEFGDLPHSYYDGDARFMLEDILHSTNPEVFPLRSGPDRLFPLTSLVAC